MAGKINFEYICAHRAHLANYLFSLAEDALDCHNSCIVWDTITFYGVPRDLSDEDIDSIQDGDYTNAIKVGSMQGCLILCKQMLVEDEDPWQICDDENGDLEGTISALKGQGCPLNEEDGDPWQDVYYIHEWNMEKGYNSAALKSEILDRLPNIILMLFHVKPDILAYYPAPLKYKPDPVLEARLQALEHISVQKLDAYFDSILGNTDSKSSASESNIRSFGVAYKLSETEQNDLIRRLEANGAYPESAKRKREFSFFGNNGFVEAGNSRLLYKVCGDF